MNFLEQADTGRYQLGEHAVDFESVNKKQAHQVVLETAMVFQSFELFAHRTILENVMEGLVVVRGVKKDVAEIEALAAIRKVGLEDKIDMYPNQLSGGQQQRVGIARAMVLQPAILLFDEPTSALDPELVNEVLGVMRELADTGQTMLIVTHEMQFARQVADKVVFMADGEVVESGSPSMVFEQSTHPRTRQFLNDLVYA